MDALKFNEVHAQINLSAYQLSLKSAGSGISLISIHSYETKSESGTVSKATVGKWVNIES